MFAPFGFISFIFFSIYPGSLSIVNPVVARLVFIFLLALTEACRTSILQCVAVIPKLVPSKMTL